MYVRVCPSVTVLCAARSPIAYCPTVTLTARDVRNSANKEVTHYALFSVFLFLLLSRGE